MINSFRIFFNSSAFSFVMCHFFQRKRELQEQAVVLFEGKRGPKPTENPEVNQEKFYS